MNIKQALRASDCPADEQKGVAIISRLRIASWNKVVCREFQHNNDPCGSIRFMQDETRGSAQRHEWFFRGFDGDNLRW